MEARDGAWCHERALNEIMLADRMLLTDVSFAIEATDATAPKRYLAVQFSSLSGWTAPVLAQDSLCAYVAFREPGNWACRMVSPASYCVCPCGQGWDDFFNAMSLSLATR